MIQGTLHTAAGNHSTVSLMPHFGKWLICLAGVLPLGTGFHFSL